MERGKKITKKEFKRLYDSGTGKEIARALCFSYDCAGTEQVLTPEQQKALMESGVRDEATQREYLFYMHIVKVARELQFQFSYYAQHIMYLREKLRRYCDKWDEADKSCDTLNTIILKLHRAGLDDYNQKIADTLVKYLLEDSQSSDYEIPLKIEPFDGEDSEVKILRVDNAKFYEKTNEVNSYLVNYISFAKGFTTAFHEVIEKYDAEDMFPRLVIESVANIENDGAPSLKYSCRYYNYLKENGKTSDASHVRRVFPSFDQIEVNKDSYEVLKKTFLLKETLLENGKEKK